MTLTADALTDAELAQISASFEGASAAEIVGWAADTFGDSLAVAASMEDSVLISVASAVRPGIDVVFVDTGYHFPETLATAERVSRRYRIELRVVREESPLDELWRTDTDACCAARKVAPFDTALRGYTAWMSGLRRADSAARAEAPIVTRDARGLISIRPLATWDDATTEAYVAEHDVVLNPLLFDGYPSVGCAPCTNRVAPGDDPRSGRWAGSGKTECGLNL
ncbi:MAG: phosphoadenylyl-sulfate reductase [Acidimicrobiia bacterium]|nr:phosphoadenylyl-sulfate reductase [Acidimicrobiia bacterium]